MIKKFILFINESYSLKTEYQIQHLDREKRLQYFTQRIEYIKKFDTTLHDYEYLLLPKLLRTEYNQLCIDRYRKIDKEQFDEFSKEQKIEFINKVINKGDTSMYFNYLSDELKNYLINKRINQEYPEYLPFEQFEWCNDELRDKYINRRLLYSDFIGDNIFSICTKEQKTKIITNLISDQIVLTDTQFKFLPVIRKYKYLSYKIKYIPLSSLSDYQRKWFLSYKKKHNL